MGKFTQYSQEELAYYNASDIAQVANSIGVTLDGNVDDKGWQRSKDSTGKPMTKLAFHLASNSFHNFESGKTDRPIGFLRDWQGMSFHEAVTYLKDHDFSKVDGSQLSAEARAGGERQKFEYNFTLNPDKTVGKNYLINKRKIHKGLVHKLFQVRLIELESEHNNLLFHYKRGKDIVGAIVQGTFISFDKYKRGTFKGVASGSEPHFGFHFSFGKPTKLYIFEAPIDAMSYYTLNPKARKDIMYGVEVGYSVPTVANLAKYAKEKGNPNIIRDGIYISVDNDAAGIKYWTQFAKLNQNYEKPLYHNNLPDFYSVPKDVLAVYQEALQNYGGEGLDLKPLLAIHKFETNFELSTRIANAGGYGRYFGEQGEAKEITVEERDERIEKLVRNYVYYQGNLEKTITNPGEKRGKNRDFEQLVQGLAESYESRLVIKDKEEIQKDWNDVLKQRVKALQPFINVSNDKALEHALETFDYNQIAQQDLEAAGIHNRKEAQAYRKEANEPGL